MTSGEVAVSLMDLKTLLEANNPGRTVATVSLEMVFTHPNAEPSWQVSYFTSGKTFDSGQKNTPKAAPTPEAAILLVRDELLAGLRGVILRHREEAERLTKLLEKWSL